MSKNTNSVTVSIYGGLGNQLFQYAIGRALAVRNHCQLWLDDRHYRTHPHFKFGLHHFNIQATTAPADQLPPDRSEWLKYFSWRLVAASKAMVRERGLQFDATVLQRQGKLYLRGYWQSEKYFAEQADSIRAEVTLRNPALGPNAEMLEQIAATYSIGLHIRRGDYVSSPQANKVHGTCSLEYYRAGVEHILKQTQTACTVYVFSDDPQWVKQNLQVDCAKVYVDINDGYAAHEDLRLMSACQHQVISNSTFSWWAAWLNRNPHKQIVAPLRWFADPTKRNDDLVPASWQRIGEVETFKRSKSA
jgi:Glycosyl transferase family 11